MPLVGFSCYSREVVGSGVPLPIIDCDFSHDITAEQPSGPPASDVISVRMEIHTVHPGYRADRHRAYVDPAITRDVWSGRARLPLYTHRCAALDQPMRWFGSAEPNPSYHFTCRG